MSAKLYSEKLICHLLKRISSNTFTDAHKKNSRIIVSTSTLVTPSLRWSVFGPVNEDCYAMGYGLRSHQSDFIIGSYRGDESDLAKQSVRALEDMVSILRATA